MTPSVVPSPARIHGSLLLVSLFFGINFVVVKEVLYVVEPRTWAFLRLSSATVCLLPLVLCKPQRWPPARLYLPLAVCAVFGVFLNQALFAVGMQLTTPEHSAVINTSIPVVTLLVAVAVGQERFAWPKLLAIAVALVGVLVLLRVDEWAGAPSSEVQSEIWLGDFLTVLNASSFAVFVVLMRRVAMRNPGEMSPMGATVFCFLVGSVLMGIFAWPQLSVEGVRKVLEPGVLWPALVSILGGTVLTYLLNNWALQHADGSKVTLYIYVQPIVATLLIVALGEPIPGPRFFVAAILVCLGLFVERIARR